jgi:capsular polysaccharide biosynthesis protein
MPAMIVCQGFWGGSSFLTTPLRTRVIENAIYTPFNPHVFLDRDPDWGIYDANGDLVPEAAYVRGETQKLVGQCRHIDPATLDLQDAPSATMIYAGPIIPHFGHFLLTSLARLWALDGSAPALFHSHPSLFEHGAPFIRDILAAANLTPRNACSLARPTRIKRLVVPEASVIEQFQVSPAYAASGGRVGAAFTETGRFGAGRYYLSKSRLTFGVAGLQEEAAVERAFVRRGFEVVYPEVLSIADQVSLFRNAVVIAGTASSAFHTVALVPYARARRMIFSYSNTPNSNFALLDHGSLGKSDYRSMFDSVRVTSRERFNIWYEAHDINVLAETMAATSVPDR